MAQRASVDLRIHADPIAVERARKRVIEAATRTGHGDPEGFFRLFPTYRAALDALPDLTPLAQVVQELRPTLLDALEMEGVQVPADAYCELRIPGHLWPDRLRATPTRIR